MGRRMVLRRTRAADVLASQRWWPVSVSTTVLVVALSAVVGGGSDSRPEPAGLVAAVAADPCPADERPAPLVRGDAVLSADEIRAWWEADDFGLHVLSNTAVDELIDLYLGESGDVENPGVAGDVAFAQAASWSTRFVNEDLDEHFNYAGVPENGELAEFDNPAAGVQAHLDLLDRYVEEGWVTTWDEVGEQWSEHLDGDEYWDDVGGIYYEILDHGSSGEDGSTGAGDDCTEPEDGEDGEDGETIHPGDTFLIPASGAVCTLGWAYSEESSRDIYFNAPVHCLWDGFDETIDGIDFYETIEGQVVSTEAGVEFGEVAIDGLSQTGQIYNYVFDWAFVSIYPAYADRVRPGVRAQPDVPTGVALEEEGTPESSDVAGFGHTSGVMERTPEETSWGGTWWTAGLRISGGDSGAPVWFEESGEALGMAITYSSAEQQEDGTHVLSGAEGLTVEYMLEEAAARGLDLELLTVTVEHDGFERDLDDYSLPRPSTWRRLAGDNWFEVSQMFAPSHGTWVPSSAILRRVYSVVEGEVTHVKEEMDAGSWPDDAPACSRRGLLIEGDDGARYLYCNVEPRQEVGETVGSGKWIGSAQKYGTDARGFWFAAQERDQRDEWVTVCPTDLLVAIMDGEPDSIGPLSTEPCP